MGWGCVRLASTGEAMGDVGAVLIEQRRGPGPVGQLDAVDRRVRGRHTTRLATRTTCLAVSARLLSRLRLVLPRSPSWA